MKCERLISLVKNWYLKVQEESMAPARMVAFMEKHIAHCEECLSDPDVKQEAAKIREIVLPPSKVTKPKVVRTAKEVIGEDEDEYKDEEESSEDEDEDVDDDDTDDDDDLDDDLLDDDDEI